MNFDQLIRFAVEQGASDVHLQTGASPLLRINGLIRTVESPPVVNQDLRQFILAIKKGLTAEQLDHALVEGLDFSYAIPGVSRFRCNIYSHLGTPAMVLRTIKLKIRTLEELKLPPVLRDITLSLARNDPAHRDDRQRQKHDLGRDGRPDQQLVPLQDHHAWKTRSNTCTPTRRP